MSAFRESLEGGCHDKQRAHQLSAKIELSTVVNTTISSDQSEGFDRCDPAPMAFPTKQSSSSVTVDIPQQRQKIGPIRASLPVCACAVPTTLDENIAVDDVGLAIKVPSLVPQSEFRNNGDIVIPGCKPLEGFFQPRKGHMDWFTAPGDSDSMSAAKSHLLPSSLSFWEPVDGTEGLDDDNIPLRRSHHPTRKRQKPSRFQSPSTDPLCNKSKVTDLSEDFSSFKCVVELPATLKPGDRCFVKWPNTTWCTQSEPIVFECPYSITAELAAPRWIVLMAPNTFVDPRQESNRSLMLRSAKTRRATNGKLSVRVGKKFQVDVIPPVCKEWTPAVDQDAWESRYDQIWDARQACEATRRGEDLEDFLSESQELNSKILRMEALHKCNYNVHRAKRCLNRLLNKVADIPIAFNQEEASLALANTAFFKKDFCKASADLGRSVCACIVHYYNWKKSVEYQRLKQKLCVICDGGGELTICFQCRDPYHLECVAASVHEGSRNVWLCQKCLQSPAAKSRKRSPGLMDPLSCSPMKLLRATASPSKMERRHTQTPQLESKKDHISHVEKLGGAFKAEKLQSNKRITPTKTPPGSATLSFQFEAPHGRTIPESQNSNVQTGAHGMAKISTQQRSTTVDELPPKQPEEGFAGNVTYRSPQMEQPKTPLRSTQPSSSDPLLSGQLQPLCQCWYCHLRPDHLRWPSTSYTNHLLPPPQAYFPQPYLVHNNFAYVRNVGRSRVGGSPLLLPAGSFAPFMHQYVYPPFWPQPPIAQTNPLQWPHSPFAAAPPGSLTRTPESSCISTAVASTTANSSTPTPIEASIPTIIGDSDPTSCNAPTPVFSTCI